MKSLMLWTCLSLWPPTDHEPADAGALPAFDERIDRPAEPHGDGEAADAPPL